MPKISIIAAVAKEGAIGRNNGLLCHLSGDLQYFKALTLGHTIIMGKNTYLSLPKGALPGRKNIVITHANTQYENTTVCNNLQDALKAEIGEEELFFIGGEQIYRQSIKIADRLYITEIDQEFKDADRFFPEIDNTIWRELSRKENNADEKNRYPYAFVVYERKKAL
ncbi:MAG: dihydrofolate reductase [Bacteroidales bacterium]